MLNISRIYCNNESPGDRLRYDSRKTGSSRKPIAVWNITNRCNLFCKHCYANANCNENIKEFTTKEAKEVIDDLADYGVPVILFSGGEPLLRDDIITLIKHTTDLGVRTVLSTNGILLSEEICYQLKEAQVTYVGISLDGTKEKHNKFRGLSTAFDSTVEGIRRCVNLDIKVGLRFTIFKNNFDQIPYIFDFMEKENIPRICFYHLVCSGRGQSMKLSDLSNEEKKATMNLIIDRTREFHDKGIKKEILTVDNHCDGPFLYLRMKHEGHPFADDALRLLNINRGDSSGMGITSIGWDGTVYPDQFWRNKPLGNIKESKFRDIWENRNNDFLNKLRNKRQHIKGRCSNCKYLEICGGSFRARAEAMTGDPWESDPGCYLTNEEIF